MPGPGEVTAPTQLTPNSHSIWTPHSTVEPGTGGGFVGDRYVAGALPKHYCQQKEIHPASTGPFVALAAQDVLDPLFPSESPMGLG
jgi:hypothetical protein